MIKNKRILILANLDIGLYKFRKNLIQELLNQGNEVFISLPKGLLVQNLQEMGCHFLETQVDRRGMNPITDIKLIKKYFKLIKKVRPDLIITYTIKPNIYGGIAARLCGVSYAVNITGLGTAFQKDNLMKKLVVFLYRRACRRAKTVFFENQENEEIFLQNNIIGKKQSCLLPGAGVDLKEYKFADYPKSENKIRFLLIGRIMREKGIEEFLLSAVNLKKQYPEVSFDIVGPMEDDYKNRIQSLEKNQMIHYYGYQEDVKPMIRESHCFVLPSYHEGMANTLLEAGAMGRPLITSRIHGCMEAVEEGKNGWLVNVRDARELEQKMKKFIELPWEEKRKMGQESRRIMEERFRKEIVVEKTMEGLKISDERMPKEK